MSDQLNGLIDFDEFMADTRAKIDDLLLKKADYYKRLTDQAKNTKTGVELDRVERQINNIEREVITLDQVVQTLNALDKFYNREMSYLWARIRAQKQDIEFLEQAYRSADENEAKYLKMLLSSITQKGN